MRNKNKLLIIPIIFLFLLTLVPMGSASYEGQLWSYTSGNAGNIWFGAQHPSQISNYSAHIEPVVPIWTANLTVVQVSIERTALTPNLGVKAMVLNSTRNGWLANSTNTIMASDLTTAFQYKNFTFDGTLQLTASTTYYIGLYCSSLTGFVSTADTILIESISSGGNDMYQFYNSGTPNYGEWKASNYHFNMKVYGNDNIVAGATPTPSPTPANGSHWIWNGTGWENNDNVVTDTTETLLPVLIPIVVLLICAGVAAYFIGFWGFILGLDIGVVILRVVAGDTYMPIWGVVLIGVGNIIVLIMGRRGGE